MEPVAVSLAAEMQLLAEVISRCGPHVTCSVPAIKHGNRVTRSYNRTVRETLVALLEAVDENPQLASAVVHPQKSLLLSALRVELIVEVFSFLFSRELRCVNEVCRTFRFVARCNDSLWQSICANAMPSWYEKITRPFAKRPTAVRQEGESVWRALLNARRQLDRTWLCGTDEVAPHLVHFPRGVHCAHFDDNELLCGSGGNNEVVVFDLHSGRKRLNTAGEPGMVGHGAAVTSMQVLDSDSNVVVTSSLDSTLRLWCRRTLMTSRIFRGHTDKVWCHQSSGGRLFSGSSDRTVRVWDLESGQEVQEIADHRTSISALKITAHTQGSTMVTGSAGNSVRAFDLGNGGVVCTMKMQGHTKGVFCLHSTPRILLSGSLDNTINIWDPRDGFKLVRTLADDFDQGQFAPGEAGVDAGIICLSCDDVKLVSGGPERVIKLWDLRMNAVARRFSGHSHWVTSVQFDDGKLISSSRDRTVRVWDINNASCAPIVLPVAS